MSHCTVILEAGINHGGSLRTAQFMAYDAKAAGANIVKFQTYDTSKLLRLNDPSYKTLQALELSRADWVALAKYCGDIKIEFLTTPGDLDSLKFAVEELGVKRIKIGSDDLTNKPLIEAAYKTGLPLIISTGMATTAEITDAIYDINNFSLMHCVSLYPCLPEQANLRSIKYLEHTFSCPVGYSDHTAKAKVVLAAVAAGASMIEVHFMLDGSTPWDSKGIKREDPIDAPVSFKIGQLHHLIYDIREMELILGVYGKKPVGLELAQAPQLRKGPDGFRGIVL